MQVDRLRRLPLLRQLNQVELAKLLPEMQEIALEAGERLESEQLEHRLHFVERGKMELRSACDEPTVWLAQAAEGEFFGETALLDRTAPPLVAVALAPSKLVVIPAGTVADLLRDKPEILAEFSREVLARSADQADQLARVRRMIAAYSDHVWSQVEIEEPAAAAQAGPAQHLIAQPVALRRQRTRTAKSRWPAWRPSRSVIGLAVAAITAGAVALGPIGTGMPQNTRYLLAILLWGSICWLFNALPDFVVALAACVGLAVTHLASPAEALSGFANATWFLLLGVWCIGVAVARTGLLYRACLNMMKLLPNSYLGQSLALAVTGMLVTPLLPSSQGRTVMAAPLTLELGEALRFRPHSNGAAGLAMASFLGFGQMYFLVPNGTTTGVLAWSLLPEAVRAHVSWSFWLLAALPLGIIVFVLTYLSTLRLLPPDSMSGVSSDTVAAQLRVLGPMRREERLSLAVILLVLLAFVSAPLHGIDPAWFAVGGMLLLVTTNILSKEMLSREVDWSFLLFFGAILSIANVARAAHLDRILAGPLHAALAPILTHPTAMVLVVGLLMVLLRMAISPIQAIPLLAIVAIPLFADAGYNPFAAVLTIMAASTTFAIPLLSPGYLAMLTGTRQRMFTEEQIRPLAWVHTAIVLAGLLASVPYWLALRAM
ncbi:MAG: ABC-type branched-chain amino acid transport system, periplasmic component [Firmicutes bacterium]|nr:ABC-type branched-chain amino acid transport system, periplasmic component [Bacillota bacterium]